MSTGIMWPLNGKLGVEEGVLLVHPARNLESVLIFLQGGMRSSFSGVCNWDSVLQFLSRGLSVLSWAVHLLLVTCCGQRPDCSSFGHLSFWVWGRSGIVPEALNTCPVWTTSDDAEAVLQREGCFSQQILANELSQYWLLVNLLIGYVTSKYNLGLSLCKQPV